MKDKTLFQDYMTGFGELFDKTITDVLKNIYWRSLEPFTDDQCRKAFDRIINSFKKRFYGDFPKPADLIEAMEADKPQIENIALVQADRIIAHLRAHGGTKWPVLDDPITKYLMSNRWHYPGWARNVIEADLKWWAKEFVTAYQAHSEADGVLYIEDVPDRIKPLIENIGGKNDQ